MTKDRRLGRGLAALLGTPLEEDLIVDGESSEKTQAKQPAASNARQAKAADTTPAAAGPTAAKVKASSTGKTLAASGRQATGMAKADQKSKASNSRKAATRVTGAIPLQRSADSESASSSLELSVYEIDNNPFQPRRQFNAEEIASLAESIREHQQLQPILVRRVGDRYQLISGERRLRATIHAGLKTIRAEVREADDRLVAELAIVENLQRKDLDPIEKALSFRRYIDEHKCTQEDLAKRLKIDRSTIANLMRLMELPEQIQHSIQSGKITAGHARALLPLGEESQQTEFASQIQTDGWSVRETERRVSDQLRVEDGEALPAAPGKGAKKRTSPQIAALEQQIRLALGTKAEIRQSASGRGKIVISFANPDEFERICSLIVPTQTNSAQQPKNAA